MLDERTCGLLHAELDGENSVSDSESLQDMLATDAAARAHFEQMRALADTLASLPQADPPATLRPSILAALQPARPSASPRAFLNYGYAFAAGALLASVALLMTPGSESRRYDISELVGTMSRPPAPAATLPVNMARVDLDVVEGTVNVFRTGDTVVVDIDMLAHQPVELITSFGTGSAPRLRGIAPPVEGTLEMTTAPGNVTVSGTGRQRYSLLLENAGPSETRIDLIVRSGGRDVHETNLLLAAEQQH